MISTVSAKGAGRACSLPGISGRAGEVLATNDGAGGAGGPRKGVVGRVGGVCGVWCRHIVATDPKEGERGGPFDGRTRERTWNFCWDPSWRGEDELPEESEQFRFLRAACYANIKGSVGLILAKASAMRISIPLDLSSLTFIPLPCLMRPGRAAPLIAPSLVFYPRRFA